MEHFVLLDHFKGLRFSGGLGKSLCAFHYLWTSFVT